MRIVSFLMSYCEDNLVDTLVVDETGVGAGVADRLEELRPGCRIVPFNGGRRARDAHRFADWNAEVWWAMRERYYSDEMDTDNDPALIGQVSGRSYTIGEDGRTRLQSKTEMHESPDEADALAMTFAARGGGNKVWM